MTPPPRRWKSLSTELTIVYASLSIALVVLLSYFTYRLNSRELEESIRQELLMTVDQTVVGINAEFQERINEVHTLTLVPALRSAAEAGTRRTERLGLQDALEDEVVSRLEKTRTQEAVARADSFLADLKENHPYIAEVFLTDRYGINAASSNPTSDTRQDDESWWQQAVIQRYYLGNLEYDESAGSYSYAVALPILDDPRPPIGIVKAVFNLRAMHDLVDSISISNRGYLVVTSPEGLILSHPREEHLYKAITSVPDLAPIAGLIRRSPRGVADFVPADSGSDHDVRMIGYTRIMRSASLGPLNWTVSAIVARSDVISSIVAVRNGTILAGLIFILAAVPALYALSRKLSRPLVDLSHRADRISTGDLSVDLSMPSTNEIGKLATSLSTMVDSLKASHKRTLEINASLERAVRERTDDIRRKNRQIEAQSKKVMEASRLKSQFLANMSHELRTPLNAVLALSEILSNETSGPLNDDQMKQVSIINRSGKSLLRLINDVLDLSKIEAGRMTIDRAPMSLHGLVTLVSDTLRPLAEDKHLSFTVHQDKDLPQFIKSDEQKLRQILINLIGNAIKFTERGSVRLEIAYTQGPPTISFSVVDTGIGMSPDVMDRVFDEFCQGDGSTTRKYGGTGLGLTISRKMAELLGGSLSVESSTDEGSRFTLSVPHEPAPPVPATPTETLRRVRLQVPEPSLMSTNDDTSTLNQAKPVVLVAEDENDNLYIMKKYLNRLGCQVVFARDGAEVLEKAKTYKPIAITLDLVLPKRNGWDVLSELKVDPETRNIPVIIASVLDNQERGFCLGAFRYLVKPVSESDLADTIDQIRTASRKDVQRILIIDDNVVDSDLLERLLAESRYDVLHASTGEEGLAKAECELPDLIMLDLGLPGIDGFQVLDRLGKGTKTRSIPVIIHTARDLTPDESKRLQEDSHRVFLKNPLEPNRMLEEIGALLRSLPQNAAGENHQTREWEETCEAVEEAATKAAGVRTILLVEDDPANQYTVELLLRREGYEVIVAENGKEGIDKAASLRPDLVLMDMMMPVMGGHQATRLLKKESDLSRIPVIALTAAAMTGDREKALAAGCDDYVSKPINSTTLLETIEHWITQSPREPAAK